MVRQTVTKSNNPHAVVYIRVCHFNLSHSMSLSAPKIPKSVVKHSKLGKCSHESEKLTAQCQKKGVLTVRSGPGLTASDIMMFIQRTKRHHKAKRLKLASSVWFQLLGYAPHLFTCDYASDKLRTKLKLHNYTMSAALRKSRDFIWQMYCLKTQASGIVSWIYRLKWHWCSWSHCITQLLQNTL